MKTLKQIREEYNSKFEAPDQLGFGDESLVLEGSVLGKTGRDDTVKKSSRTVPSVKDMPVLLIFRRLQYRIFPNKQVVVLYYSKAIDKYLSVPMGPGGSVNLSEAVIHDTLDEGLGDAIEAGRQWLHDKVKDSKTFKAAQELGHHLPGYGNVKAAKEKWAKGDKWGAAKEAGKSLAKAAATGAGVAIGGYAATRAAPAIARAALGKAATGGSGDSNTSSAPQSSGSSTNYPRSAGAIKTGTSWTGKKGSDAVAQSKLKQAALKDAAKLKENKMSDIRAMIDSGAILHELNINGKTVTLNNTMAKRILEVYDSVNTKNKKIVEGMLNEDLESFKKLLNFSIRK